MVGLCEHSRDSCGLDAVSFHTFNLIKMSAVTTVLQIHTCSERVADLPKATQLEKGDIIPEFQVCMVPKSLFSTSANRFGRNDG